MPLPLILGVGAAVAGLAGVGSGVHGAVKMKEANDTMKLAEEKHQKNIERFEEVNEKTNKIMDRLGTLELEILKSFEQFSDIMEKIQNRPEFMTYKVAGVELPKYNKEELNKVSVGAGLLLGGLGGAAVGTAGGFAAAGATTTAVMALGTASTGTAIASLSGVAATNATLAALGGGAIAAGGGGMALGTTILGATTLGAGILVGGVIFNLVGGKLSDKADEAYAQMERAQETINALCTYLVGLRMSAQDYTTSLMKVNHQYTRRCSYLSYLVNDQKKVDYEQFTDEEKDMLENTVMLVGLLYNMCKVKLVSAAKEKAIGKEVNVREIKENIAKSEEVLGKITCYE